MALILEAGNTVIRSETRRVLWPVGVIPINWDILTAHVIRGIVVVLTFDFPCTRPT